MVRSDTRSPGITTRHYHSSCFPELSPGTLSAVGRRGYASAAELLTHLFAMAPPLYHWCPCSYRAFRTNSSLYTATALLRGVAPTRQTSQSASISRSPVLLPPYKRTLFVAAAISHHTRRIALRATSEHIRHAARFAAPRVTGAIAVPF